MDEGRGGGAGEDHLGGADGVRPDGRDGRVAAVRAMARLGASVQAEQLRLVAEIAAECTAEARAQLAGTSQVPGIPSEAELVDSLVTGELMCMLGIAKRPAEGLHALAVRLVRVLPATLAALEAGRIDLPRAEVLSEATAVLDDDASRAVQDLVLPTAGQAPWDGPSPRTWRARVDRAVVTVDADAARRRREQAIRERAVRAWWPGDGTGVLQITSTDVDIALADRVITDLAHGWPATGPEGDRLGMDQRRVDALIDLFRRVAAGTELPGVKPRRDREVGIVLHADTLFADGPGKDDPGELRGLGAPAPVDPRSAAAMARAEIAAGAGTRVLLVDTAGTLRRTVRLPVAPPGGWTRPQLTKAVREALPGLPELHTDGYELTVAITEHVRAAHPRCTSYDCARVAARCDLDHDRPWPRGPTAASNLSPRCRRHHGLKTRGLLHTWLHHDGRLTTTTLLGLTVTTRPEPLPGHGAGEAYAP